MSTNKETTLNKIESWETMQKCKDVKQGQYCVFELSVDLLVIISQIIKKMHEEALETPSKDEVRFKTKNIEELIIKLIQKKYPEMDNINFKECKNKIFHTIMIMLNNI